MFNDKSILAVDIGSKYIKMVQGRVKGSNVSLVNYGICKSPYNTSIDQGMGDKRDIAKAVSDLIASRNIKCKNVVIGIKGQDIITRHIEMPILSDKQLKQAVKLEIQQYLSMDPNEYVIDSRKICKIETKEKKAYNVLLVAAPKKMINDYLFIADKLGLKIDAIDLFSNSIVRLFEAKDMSKNGAGTGKCIATIDIGYVSSIVTLIEDGKLFFERELAMGIKDIDVMLEKAFAASPEEIDSIRDRTINLNASEKDTDNADPRVYYANNNARQIVDRLIDNFIKIFDFYTSSGINKNISYVYLHGGGSKLKGIVDYIGSSINIETKAVNADIVSGVHNINDEIMENIELYTNCISLLLRKE